MRMVVIALILAPSLDCMADATDGEYGWWYLGGGISLNNVFAVTGSGLAESSERGNADAGFVLNGGYRFGPAIAIEIAYIDGGTPSIDTVTPQVCNATLCQVHVEQRTTAFEVSAILLLPFRTIWELYFKAGAAVWNASSDQVLTPLQSGAVTTSEVSTAGTDLMMGLGAGVKLGDKMRARLEYHAFRTEDDLLVLEPLREARFDVVSLELHWQF